MNRAAFLDDQREELKQIVQAGWKKNEKLTAMNGGKNESVRSC
jgi:hypothetical protein